MLHFTSPPLPSLPPLLFFLPRPPLFHYLPSLFSCFNLYPLLPPFPTHYPFPSLSFSHIASPALSSHRLPSLPDPLFAPLNFLFYASFSSFSSSSYSSSIPLPNFPYPLLFFPSSFLSLSLFPLSLPFLFFLSQLLYTIFPSLFLPSIHEYPTYPILQTLSMPFFTPSFRPFSSIITTLIIFPKSLPSLHSPFPFI